ncbi:unnamed protein product, partial [Polarella glacialis]
VRSRAPEFYRQYVLVEAKAGKTKWSLVLQCDAFLTVMTEKLFALAALQHLPEILERQQVLDSAGSATRRWRLVREFQKVPPPLAAVAVAFGIDVRERLPNLSPDRLIVDWQRSNLWTRRRTNKIKPELLPT